MNRNQIAGEEGKIILVIRAAECATISVPKAHHACKMAGLDL